MNYLILATAFTCASLAHAQTTLIAESFGGSSLDDLNGTTADTFNAAITTAGGSSTWVASSLFKADGSTNGPSTSAGDAAAFLNLGSYIDDAKGTATGLFTFEATLTQPTDSSSWISFGMFNGDQVINMHFANPGAKGMATAIIRDSALDQIAFFPAIGSSVSSGNLAYTDPSVTFTTVLDLTTYDGVTDFGNIAYYTDGGVNPVYTFDYVAANTFQQIGFSINDGPNTTMSDFTLTQIPEASTYAMLAGCVAFLLVAVRRTVR